MRKFVLSGVAALGFLAVGMTVMGQPAAFRQADAEGSGADVRVTRHNLVAMVDTNHTKRPLLVADARTASLARSLLVADAEGSGADIHAIRTAMVEPPNPC